MTARVITVDPLHPDPALLRGAASLLRAGNLVAFPTETVYGLGGLALSEAALSAIFRAKGRPPTHPLIAHVLGVDQARALVSAWPAEAGALADRFWPGPLTLVLPRRESVPAALSGGKPTVAVRAPAHLVARALIAAAGAPLAAPSANRYQALSPTLAVHVQRSLGERIPLILDGGPCALGLESAVVDLSGTSPRLLRPGTLSLEELRAVLPKLELGPQAASIESERHSPGQDAVHYAPRAPLEIVSRSDALARSAACASVGVVLRGGPAPGGAHQVLLSREAAAFATGLFAALHALDAAGVSAILVEAPPASAPWRAVRDRLDRAGRKRER